MRDTKRCLSGSLFVMLAISCGGPAAGQTRTAPPALVQGRITVVMNVNRKVDTYPLRNLAVYLFRLDQSRPLQELQRKCRRAMARPNADAFVAYNACTSSLSEAAQLVPSLTYTARAETDRDGAYRFESVAPAQRYQVVSVKFEGDEPSVIIGLTPKLKAGQHFTLNLSENDPWTEADPLLH